jgi:lipid II:glycine glycyltransferase (peptidoglycan interpeptide bridge formation enzyme)
MELFQSDNYLSFIEDTGIFESFKFSSSSREQEIGRIQGYIQRDGGSLKGYLSRRAIINGGPYLADGITDEEIETLLKQCIDGLKRKVIYIESRNFKDYSSYKSVFEKVGFKYEPHYDFIIDTKDVETVDANMGKSRKRDVKTSIKNGASIVESPTVDDIKAFYAVLKDLYQKKVKTPLFPESFFLKLWEMPFSKFILVSFQEKIIGGTVCVFDDNTVYEWFACGQDGVFKNVYPSTVATYYGILFAAENDFKHFDMMGAGAPGDGGYGVRDFKAKFGGQLVEYGRFKYIANKPLYAIGKLGVSIMKKI